MAWREVTPEQRRMAKETYIASYLSPGLVSKLCDRVVQAQSESEFLTPDALTCDIDPHDLALFYQAVNIYHYGDICIDFEGGSIWL